MKDKNEHMDLFENLNDNEAWKKEWKGMPEFEQKDLTPKHSIIINFKDFCKLVKQDLTDKTKSIWFPAQEKEPPKNLGYVLFDENKDKKDE
jgi:hypothetical protein